MKQQYLQADLKSCRDLLWGRRIHARVVESRSDNNKYIVTALIKMYAKSRSMVDARRVFDSMRNPDGVSWTALLLGYAETGEGHTGLDLFSRMKKHGLTPDSVTYVAAVKSCTSLAVNGDHIGCLERGKDIHSEVGCHMNHFVKSALIDMYSKCHCIVAARSVFDSLENPDVVSWNALILGYAEHGEGNVSLDLFAKMKASGCAPNSISYVGALKACTSLASNGNVIEKEDFLERGRQIHSEIGFHLNHYVQNTLIDMYSKFRSMVDARRVFDRMQKPDVVSWSALLLGYAETGEGHLVLDLFSRMKARGCVPDSGAYLAVIKACGSTGALALGRKSHTEITVFTTHLVTSLVDFYAKCGSMVEAREVFDLNSRARDVTTWTALLSGYSSLGDSHTVFNLFEAMQEEGLRPDDVTFVCLLLCCSHAGFVKKARDYLDEMPVKYRVTPTVIHYNCMVDVLGRANQLNEAISLIRQMQCNPDIVTWMTLLAACRKWKNVEIGRGAFQALVDMDKQNAYAYVLMGQIYRSRNMWQEQERVLETRNKFGARKQQPGQAYIMDEAGKMVTFVSGEEDSPEVEEQLQQLYEGMKEHGHVSAAVENEEECGHNERRAVAYGILKTSPGEPVRVFKDSRMCEGCHSTTKMFSKFSERVLMVRDSSRFHVMENGSCSCGDFW